MNFRIICPDRAQGGTRAKAPRPAGIVWDPDGLADEAATRDEADLFAKDHWDGGDERVQIVEAATGVVLRELPRA